MNLLECLSAFVRLLLTSTLLVASALAQTPAYTVIPILPPGSAGRALAADINDKGSVAATRLLTGTQPQAFVWRHGRSEILPTLGGTCSFGSGINDLEHVVGTSCLAGDTIQHAYLWRHNHLMDFDTFGGTGSGAVGVNRLDEIVGEYSLSDGSTHGYFWRNGEWADVGSLGGSQTRLYPTEVRARLSEALDYKRFASFRS